MTGLRTLLVFTAAAAARAGNCYSCDCFVSKVTDVIEGPCAGASDCDHEAFAPGHECRLAAAALSSAYETENTQCLIRAADRLHDRADEVAAVLTCPERRQADEEAEAGEVTTRAGSFDGDCSAFLGHAREVEEACKHATCCADVAEDITCKAAATGLHSMYPQNAINYCPWALQLRGGCFVRQVAACALQAEIHEILYVEPWRPTCSRFAAMAYQEDKALVEAEADVVEAEDEGKDKAWKLKCVLLLLLGSISFVAIVAVAYSCVLRKKIRVLAIETRAPTARVEVRPVQKAKVLDVEAPPGAKLPAARKADVEEAVASPDVEEAVVSPVVSD